VLGYFASLPIAQCMYTGLAIWGDWSIALLNRSSKHPPGDGIFDRLL